MAKDSFFEVKGSGFQNTLTADPEVFVGNAVDESACVGADIRRNKKALFLYQQAQMAGSMARGMDDAKAAGDGEDLAILQATIYRYGINVLRRAFDEQVPDKPVGKAGSKHQGMLARQPFFDLCSRVGMRPYGNFPQRLQFGRAAGMVGVGMGEDDPPDIGRVETGCLDGFYDFSGAARHTGVDKGKTILIFDYEGINETQGDRQ